MYIYIHEYTMRKGNLYRQFLYRHKYIAIEKNIPWTQPFLSSRIVYKYIYEKSPQSTEYARVAFGWSCKNFRAMLEFSCSMAINKAKRY